MNVHGLTYHGHARLFTRHRYLLYGAVSAKVAEEMRKPQVQDLFAKLIMRTSPKSYVQVLNASYSSGSGSNQ